MEAIYPGDGDPEAVPAPHRETEGEADRTSVTVEVDGEVFALRPDEQGGTGYTWLSGPNAGYGFGVTPTTDLSLDEHRENIRAFLAEIDSSTGYLQDG